MIKRSFYHFNVIFSFSKIDEYGFERTTNFDYNGYESFMSEYLPILTRRTQKWEKYVDKVQRNSKTKRYSRKGIPINHRAKVSKLSCFLYKEKLKHCNIF